MSGLIMKTPAISLIIAISAMLVVCALTASSNMDIDYSHNVEGTGTVITDYKMGSSQSTEAVGKVRGTGEVMNRYIFQSNNSENVTIEDQFFFSQAPEAREISINDYPQMTNVTGGFRLLGTVWAGMINLSARN
ncbi:MAG: hypothetical protein GYA29_07245 [Methanothrix sp.]|nr:hypothetical protein [Methanothrix sp.]